MNTNTDRSRPEYLTPPKVGELLGVGHEEILRFIRSGEVNLVSPHKVYKLDDNVSQPARNSPKNGDYMLPTPHEAN